MWQSIASFAEAELKAKTEAAQRSYERLERATLELQRNVNVGMLRATLASLAASQPWAIHESIAR